MGEVYRAYHERLDRRVALKQLLPETAEDPHARKRLRREAQSAARLNHPAIVQVFDIIEVEGHDWIVMELVEGQPLSGLLKAGRLSLELILSIALELASGLESAHAKGVVHRDLKPSNVVITAGGHVKILDFGLAKQLGSQESRASISVDGELLGTPSSMSPEQAQGGEVDHRSDLFSLGVLLYEMATGESPFLDVSLIATLRRVCVHPQVPAHKKVPELPLELSCLIDRLLEKSPAKRPENAAEVIEALRRVPLPAGADEPLPPVPAAAAAPTALSDSTLDERFGLQETLDYRLTGKRRRSQS